ncbi:MAG: cytochrome c-type biogenesis protein [Hyphomonadaceae bacterium]
MIAALLLAIAVGGDTPLDNPDQEARAQSLMREIRCVVCENEPVSHSTADIAVDMRRTIRSQVAAGESNEAVREFFAERYGQFVLFRPPTNGAGALIWLFPFALLAVIGAVMLRGAFRWRKSHAGVQPESELQDD